MALTLLAQLFAHALTRSPAHTSCTCTYMLAAMGAHNAIRGLFPHTYTFVALAHLHTALHTHSSSPHNSPLMLSPRTALAHPRAQPHARALRTAFEASLLGKRSLTPCQGWVFCSSTCFPLLSRNAMSSFLFLPPWPPVVLTTLTPAAARSSPTFLAVLSRSVCPRCSSQASLFSLH